MSAKYSLLVIVVVACLLMFNSFMAKHQGAQSTGFGIEAQQH